MGPTGQIKTTFPRTGVPLGIQPDTTYAGSPEITLTSGDLILLTTDGIEETMAADNSLFGIERILDVLRANRSKPSAEIIRALYKAARDFSSNAPQTDDITAIVIKIQ
jgi:sigma-B regulation protein RsbU (phosphoserine phosphatase)